ncbi:MULTISPECIES: isoprenylcysteine carboxylmethyltransferase family protein [Terrabacteria group]|uniref:methyltransferase family protein n=1 Tax=Bacillati TaxID=1783272 RepID=UPI001C6F4EBB|nr:MULTISPECIES: isoprenylcysteine carboxylmethyltransferase family protein [Terrabacteria group]MBW9212419.1 isoprenylcysteine carboxylmethyltransferase family protein [Trueperella sp. zg.1013]
MNKIASEKILNIWERDILKNKHLPVFGVGPVYVSCCLILTIIGISIRNTGFLRQGSLQGVKYIAIIIGILFILSGLALWVYAVLIQKISLEIKKGSLVTQGAYSIVRNPIYSAFFMIFTGSLIMAHNLYLLILPVVFYISLTILMKVTEEKWLLGKFGNDYKEYCKKTNRIIPWFRRG